MRVSKEASHEENLRNTSPRVGEDRERGMGVLSLRPFFVYLIGFIEITGGYHGTICFPGGDVFCYLATGCSSVLGCIFLLLLLLLFSAVNCF